MTEKTRNHNPYWNNLSEEEKRAIHDPRDYFIISVINSMPKEKIKEIYRSIRLKDNLGDHYLREERVWVNDAVWFLGRKLGKDARHGLELADEILENVLSEKFMLYYAAKYRPNIETPTNSKLIDFLSLVDTEQSN